MIYFREVTLKLPCMVVVHVQRCIRAMRWCTRSVIKRIHRENTQSPMCLQLLPARLPFVSWASAHFWREPARRCRRRRDIAVGIYRWTCQPPSTYHSRTATVDDRKNADCKIAVETLVSYRTDEAIRWLDARQNNLTKWRHFMKLE